MKNKLTLYAEVPCTFSLVRGGASHTGPARLYADTQAGLALCYVPTDDFPAPDAREPLWVVVHQASQRALAWGLTLSYARRFCVALDEVAMAMRVEVDWTEAPIRAPSAFIRMVPSLQDAMTEAYEAGMAAREVRIDVVSAPAGPDAMRIIIDEAKRLIAKDSDA